MVRSRKIFGPGLCLILVSILVGPRCFANVSTPSASKEVYKNTENNSKVDSSYAGLRLNHGTKNVTVDIFPNRTPSECRVLTNSDGENDYFVPAGSLDEWHSFIENKPGAITIAPCAGVCGTANGKTYARASDINASELCSSGKSSIVSNAGGFSWTCTNGSSALCYARKPCSNLGSLTSVESCPIGQTGSITYSQYYSCPGGYEPGSYGSKIQTSNSCVSSYVSVKFPSYTCTPTNFWTYGTGSKSHTVDSCGNSYTTLYSPIGISITTGKNFSSVSYNYGTGYVSTYSANGTGSLSSGRTYGSYNSNYGFGSYSSGNILNSVNTYGVSYYSGQNISSSWGVGGSIYSWR